MDCNHTGFLENGWVTFQHHFFFRQEKYAATETQTALMFEVTVTERIQVIYTALQNSKAEGGENSCALTIFDIHDAGHGGHTLCPAHEKSWDLYVTASKLSDLSGPQTDLVQASAL